jgi:hypothetical protein
MALAQPELTSTDEIIAACDSRISGSFANQSASREAIRLAHAAIARSREQIDKPFANPTR